MLSDAVHSGFYSIDPMYMIIPGLAIFITVMAFNLFGDGLRDALDPRSAGRPVRSTRPSRADTRQEAFHLMSETQEH